MYVLLVGNLLILRYTYWFNVCALTINCPAIELSFSVWWASLWSLNAIYSRGLQFLVHYVTFEPFSLSVISMTQWKINKKNFSSPSKLCKKKNYFLMIFMVIFSLLFLPSNIFMTNWLNTHTLLLHLYTYNYSLCGLKRATK